MNLDFNQNLIGNFHSHSQIARVLTENWVQENLYCPRCGNPHIQHLKNNLPAADFYCPFCQNQFELKSKSTPFGHRVPDGAYETLLERIQSNQNPDFLFLHYSKEDWSVQDLILVPKYFFVPDIIEKRPPLSDSARRAGWVGCNIVISQIPEQGKIPIISHSAAANREDVVRKVQKSAHLEAQNLNSRGWILDMLNCINRIPAPVFTLQDAYAFETELQIRHPLNHNIQPKIRQQLQFLRDKGFLEFLGDGRYRKLE